MRLTVRLTPRAGRDGIDGLAEIDGRPVLRLRVASPPVDGAANAALVKLVAKTLGVPRSAVRIASGETARIKTLEIAGDGAALAARCAALTEGF
ncbi:DUF167 domain-containing protein [Paralimibaculum aggregatum]|nr:DUF167 domain-containing protein [Limibaculum sp. NKW23]